MKKILLILMTTAALLTGCVASNGETTTASPAPQETSNPLVFISHFDGFNFYYDRDTKVVYAAFYKGGVIMLVNADGTPKLYEK